MLGPEIYTAIDRLETNRLYESDQALRNFFN